MLIYPAIDILDRKCVRLLRGDYSQQKTYSEAPAAVAAGFCEAGAKFIHTVDLNAAKSGEITNLETIAQMCAAVNIPVQVGGGIRSMEAAKRYFDIGVKRVILGTAAIKDFDLLVKLTECYPNRIVVSLDVNGTEIMIKGWTEGSSVNIFDFLKKIASLDIAAVVATDISRDGMLEGPSFELYTDMQRVSSHNIIASGGIGSINDVKKLAKLNLSGAIVGKAIYEGRISLSELLGNGGIQC